MNRERHDAAGVCEGDILAGKYRVEKILGSGGMGVVVAAHHVHLDQRVALKFLLPEALNNPEAVARFAREGRAAVKIKSEHIARVIDVGVLENGAPYIVMEYLEGGDLAAWLRQRGPLPMEQAVEFILQACEALADAHGLGIVHRDLKPANLFCVRRSDGLLSIKVLDFGISKVTGSAATGSDMGMTKTSVMMGSPLYMSPEQMRSSRDVDARTDIWALGIILFELLVGHPPFYADSIPELYVKVLTTSAGSILQKRPDLPAGLDSAIARCLGKSPADRYLNVAELANALAEFAPKRARATIERISRVIQNAGPIGQRAGAPPVLRSGGPRRPFIAANPDGMGRNETPHPLALDDPAIRRCRAGARDRSRWSSLASERTSRRHDASPRARCSVVLRRRKRVRLRYASSLRRPLLRLSSPPRLPLPPRPKFPSSHSACPARPSAGRVPQGGNPPSVSRFRGNQGRQTQRPAQRRRASSPASQATPAPVDPFAQPK